MSSKFFQTDAKTKIVEAVREVESQSSAEIVVSVRGRSDDYRDVDMLAGVAVALVTIFVLIFHPREMDEELMPLETLAAFAFGSILVSRVGALKRALISTRRMKERVLSAARAHFVEAGVSRTRDRSGILVFVSELERAVSIVPDIGIETAKLGAEWNAAVARLEAATQQLDVDGVAAALRALGPVLGKAYPRREDDVNELPDSPDMKTETAR